MTVSLQRWLANPMRAVIGWAQLGTRKSLHQFLWNSLALLIMLSISWPQPQEFPFSAVKMPGDCRGRFRNVAKCSHAVFNKQHNKGICHHTSPSVPGRLPPAQWHAYRLFSSSLLILSNYMWHPPSITQWKRPSFWQGNEEDWLGNKSCHKQHFFLRWRIWSRSPAFDFQWLKGYFLPT